jgi:hypothetical protein
MKAAQAGLALFEGGKTEVSFDTEGATKFKAEHEAAIKAKEAEAEALTGKDNKKARTEKTKEASAMKNDPKYIDACKVVKGLEAPNGNFMTKTEEGAKAKATESAAKDQAASKKDEKKDDKKAGKKQESAGLSKAERDELEKLKTDIIKRKADLKAEGMSGGQCNKDEQVVEMVKRMTELKIKEDPSLAEGDGKKPKDKEAKANKTEEKMALEKKIEEYRLELINNFGYSNKDIKADPDMTDMQKQLAKMK